MIVYRRRVRFEEVDAARILFFGRFLNYAHEAMEHFFEGLDGGYARLIIERETGLPAVGVTMKFLAPVRYGDVLRIETTTAKLGNRSAVLRYRMFFDDREPAVLAAEVEHTVVVSDLVAMHSKDMPDDVRATFAAHRESRVPA